MDWRARGIAVAIATAACVAAPVQETPSAKQESRGQELIDGKLLDHDYGFELRVPGPGWELWDERVAAGMDPKACAGLRHLGRGVHALLRVHATEGRDLAALQREWEERRDAQVIGHSAAELATGEALRLRCNANDLDRYDKVEVCVQARGGQFFELEFIGSGPPDESLWSDALQALHPAQNCVPHPRPTSLADEVYPRGFLREGSFWELDAGCRFQLPEGWSRMLSFYAGYLVSSGPTSQSDQVEFSWEPRRVDPAVRASRLEAFAAESPQARVVRIETHHGSLPVRVVQLRDERGETSSNRDASALIALDEWLLACRARGRGIEEDRLLAALEIGIEAIRHIDPARLEELRAEHAAWRASPENDSEAGALLDGRLRRGLYQCFGEGWVFRRLPWERFELQVGTSAYTDRPHFLGFDRERETRFELSSRRAFASAQETHEDCHGWDPERRIETREFALGSIGLPFEKQHVPISTFAFAGDPWEQRGIEERLAIATVPLPGSRILDVKLWSPADREPGAMAEMVELLQHLRIGANPLPMREELGHGWIDWSEGFKVLPDESSWQRSDTSEHLLEMTHPSAWFRLSTHPPSEQYGSPGARRQLELSVLEQLAARIGRDRAGSRTRSLGEDRLGDLPARGYAFDAITGVREDELQYWFAWLDGQLLELEIGAWAGSALDAAIADRIRTFFHRL